MPILFNINGHPVPVSGQWVRMLVTVSGKRGDIHWRVRETGREREGGVVQNQTVTLLV